MLKRAIVTTAIVLVIASNAYSNLIGTVLSDGSGVALGIDGIGVDYPEYNVRFLAGSFDSFTPDSWTFIGNQEGARAISDAINSLLTEGGWTSVTPDENGRSDTYKIPYREFVSSIGTHHVELAGGSNYSHPDIWYGLYGQNATFVPTVYARFTPAPSVTTTQSYLTDYLTLGDTFTFDYWWEMGVEPTGFNLDVLFFNGTEWETFGWALNFDGTSDQWDTASFWVPPWARGENVQIMFSLLDLGQETNPTVYLRNIGSAATSVPDAPSTILLGTSLLGLFGASRKKFKKQ